MCHFGVRGLANVGGIVGTAGVSGGIVCVEEEGGVRIRGEGSAAMVIEWQLWW